MCECGNDDGVDRALTEATVDEQRAWTVELGRRDPQFLRIISANADEGQGEYEMRSTTTGKVLKRVFTFEGVRILTPNFAKPGNAVTTAEGFAPPDPYQREIAQLKAAEATDLSRFEDAYKRASLDDAMAMRAKLDCVEPRRMTAAEEAELAQYAPPDPYKAGLDKMRSEGR
jgi:hypothetical protein